MLGNSSLRDRGAASVELRASALAPPVRLIVAGSPARGFERSGRSMVPSNVAISPIALSSAWSDSRGQGAGVGTTSPRLLVQAAGTPRDIGPAISGPMPSVGVAR